MLTKTEQKLLIAILKEGRTDPMTDLKFCFSNDICKWDKYNFDKRKVIENLENLAKHDLITMKNLEKLTNAAITEEEERKAPKKLPKGAIPFDIPTRQKIKKSLKIIYKEFERPRVSWVLLTENGIQFAKLLRDAK